MRRVGPSISKCLFLVSPRIGSHIAVSTVNPICQQKARKESDSKLG
jgi:hypothetical protein